MCTCFLGVGYSFLFGLSMIGSCHYSAYWGSLFFSFELQMIKIHVVLHVCFLQRKRSSGLVPIKNIDTVLPG